MDDQQGIAGLQDYLARRLVDVIAATGDGSDQQVVVLLEGAVGNAAADKTAAIVDISCASLTILVHFSHGEDMVVGGDQLVALGQFV